MFEYFCYVCWLALFAKYVMIINFFNIISMRYQKPMHRRNTFKLYLLFCFYRTAIYVENSPYFNSSALWIS